MLFSLIGCTSDLKNPHLSKAAEIVDLSPERAIALLDSIDYKELSQSDKNFYNFLQIKSSDKAYITHTSDSLILTVIDYYTRHNHDKIYPEALYYGGRVYSDLGDYPTALSYYQSALDITSESNKFRNLRKRILSQTGRLLNNLSLYDEAIPYIKQALALDSLNNDTINYVYDLQLLGGVYLRANKTDSAERCFRKSLIFSPNLDSTFYAKSKMYLAASKYQSGDIDSALFYIRNTAEQVKPLVRNSALGYAAYIYRNAGVPDSAYINAMKLIYSDDWLNKNSGYDVLLSDELAHLVPIDSAKKYIVDYKIYMEKTLEQNGNHEAVLQNTLYNYRVHERERIKAEHSKRVIQNWLFTSIIFILVLSCLILYLKNRNKTQFIMLQTALSNLSNLEHSLKNNTLNSVPSKSKFQDDYSLNKNIAGETVAELRDELRSKLYNLYEKSNNAVTISPSILQSEEYHRLQYKISKGEGIKEDDSLWDELESSIIRSSPNFRQNLQLLLGGKLMSYDLHTAILIKCGISPTQMATLLNRTKGTIVSRRESLCLRVFDKKLGTKVIDAIIRLL